MLPGVAAAQTVNCAAADAPASHNMDTCQGVCSYAANAWSCDLSSFCANGQSSSATLISDYGGAGSDYSAWGTCSNGPQFCCAHTEQQGLSVHAIELTGTDQGDALRFTDSGENLKPARAHGISAYMYGGSNGDNAETLYGSNESSASYHEELHGEGGPDGILGNGGDDYLYGGPGADSIDGGLGNDRIDGGEDDDGLDGGAGNDTLCDTTAGLEDGMCAGVGGNLMLGGGGNNRLWYETTAACNNMYTLNAGSDAGGGAVDECGNDADWGALAWMGCDVDISVKPTTCP